MSLEVINFQKLAGIENLWHIAFESPESKSREECAQLLVDMFLRQPDPQIKLQLIEKTLL